MNLRFLARVGLVLGAVAVACTDSEEAAPSATVEPDAGGADAAPQTESPDAAAHDEDAATDGGFHDADATTDPNADNFALGAVTLTEQASAANTDGFDPLISLYHRRTDYPPYASLYVGSSWSDSLGFVSETSLDIFTAGGSTLAGTYVLGGEGYGHASMMTSKQNAGGFDYQCEAAGGTLTVTDDGPGKKSTGSFTVTAWTGGAACPATPTTGSFHVLHEPDDLTGNPGTQGDSFTIDSVTYTEGGELLYSPFVRARHYGTNKTLIVTMRAAPDVTDAGSATEHHLELYVYGNGSTAGGTYSTGAGALVTYQSGDLSCLAPVDGNGSVTLSAYGDVGSVIEGTITVNGWNTETGPGCPTTPWTVPFSATREADE
jgi:hypothetical protein